MVDITITKEQAMSLIDHSLKSIAEEEAMFPGYDAYYSGVRRGLFRAKEIIGLIGKPNCLSADIKKNLEVKS